jgi:hypothetical protein
VRAPLRTPGDEARREIEGLLAEFAEHEGAASAGVGAKT